jgi:hypothetical protein
VIEDESTGRCEELEQRDLWVLEESESVMLTVSVSTYRGLHAWGTLHRTKHTSHGKRIPYGRSQAFADFIERHE